MSSLSISHCLSSWHAATQCWNNMEARDLTGRTQCSCARHNTESQSVRSARTWESVGSVSMMPLDRLIPASCVENKAFKIVGPHLWVRCHRKPKSGWQFGIQIFQLTQTITWKSLEQMDFYNSWRKQRLILKKLSHDLYAISAVPKHPSEASVRISHEYPVRGGLEHIALTAII